MALSNDTGRSADRPNTNSHPTPSTRRSLRRVAPDSTAGLARVRRSSAIASAGSSAAGRPVLPVSPRRSGGRNALSVVVMTLAVGLVATVAIPSYAFDPVANASPEFARSDLATLTAEQAQSVDVPETTAQTAVSRDDYTATSMEEIQAARDAAAAVVAAEAARASAAATFSSYSGPTASDFLANPPYPDFSLDQVYQVGLQYQGVPYVYGGSNPSGFDCSGFVMFVYAQFGIQLAHSVRSQAASGTVIDPASARPGDLVIFSDGSHDGIYAGNGNILHAPYEGTSVRVQPIWDSVYYVRLGI